MRCWSRLLWQSKTWHKQLPISLICLFLQQVNVDLGRTCFVQHGCCSRLASVLLYSMNPSALEGFHAPHARGAVDQIALFPCRRELAHGPNQAPSAVMP